MTSGEVARALQLLKMTMLRAIERGELRSWRTPGGHCRVMREDVEAFARSTPTRWR